MQNVHTISGTLRRITFIVICETGECALFSNFGFGVIVVYFLCFWFCLCFTFYIFIYNQLFVWLQNLHNWWLEMESLAETFTLANKKVVCVLGNRTSVVMISTFHEMMIIKQDDWSNLCNYPIRFRNTLIYNISIFMIFVFIAPNTTYCTQYISDAAICACVWWEKSHKTITHYNFLYVNETAQRKIEREREREWWKLECAYDYIYHSLITSNSIALATLSIFFHTSHTFFHFSHYLQNE